MLGYNFDTKVGTEERVVFVFTFEGLPKGKRGCDLRSGAWNGAVRPLMVICTLRIAERGEGVVSCVLGLSVEV